MNGDLINVNVVNKCILNIDKMGLMYKLKIKLKMLIKK